MKTLFATVIVVALAVGFFGCSKMGVRTMANIGLVTACGGSDG